MDIAPAVGDTNLDVLDGAGGYVFEEVVVFAAGGGLVTDFHEALGFPDVVEMLVERVVGRIRALDYPGHCGHLGSAGPDLGHAPLVVPEIDVAIERIVVYAAEALAGEAAGNQGVHGVRVIRVDGMELPVYVLAFDVEFDEAAGGSVLAYFAAA